MKKEKDVNSHVILAKSILERFAYNDTKGNHMIHYLDINTLQIKQEKTSSFNTIFGYYNKENEKILSDEAESKIGNIIKKLQQLNSDTIISEKDIDSMYKFVSYQIIRTDCFAEILKENLEVNLDNKAIKNAFIKEEAKLKIIYQIIEKTDIHIIINKTSMKFVLPANLMYTFNFDEDEFVWLQILSPDIALAFVRQGTISKLSNGQDKNKVKIIEFEEENVNLINNFNLRALNAQIVDRHELRYVVGLDNELDYLLNIINRIKE